MRTLRVESSLRREKYAGRDLERMVTCTEEGGRAIPQEGPMVANDLV